MKNNKIATYCFLIIILMVFSSRSVCQNISTVIYKNIDIEPSLCPDVPWRVDIEEVHKDTILFTMNRPEKRTKEYEKDSESPVSDIYYFKTGKHIVGVEFFRGSPKFGYSFSTRKEWSTRHSKECLVCEYLNVTSSYGVGVLFYFNDAAVLFAIYPC